MSQTPTFIEMLRLSMDARLLDLHVALPARVQRYDASNLTIEAKPLLKQAYYDDAGDRQVKDLPVITGVPVVFPGAGAYRLTFPINAGDLVLLVFSEGALDSWLVNDTTPVDPGDDRRNALTDAIAIPGLRSLKAPSAASEAAAVLEGPEIRLGSASASEKAAFNSDLEELRSTIAGAGSGDAIPGAVGALGPYTGASKVKVI